MLFIYSKKQSTPPPPPFPPHTHTRTHTGAKSTQKSTENQQVVVGKEEEKATSSEVTGSGAAVSACVSDVEEALKDAGIYRDSLSGIR